VRGDRGLWERSVGVGVDGVGQVEVVVPGHVRNVRAQGRTRQLRARVVGPGIYQSFGRLLAATAIRARLTLWRRLPLTLIWTRRTLRLLPRPLIWTPLNLRNLTPIRILVTLR